MSIVTQSLYCIGLRCLLCRVSIRGDADGPVVGSESSSNCDSIFLPVGSEREFAFLYHRAIAARRRKTQPAAPKSRLTNQNERFFVSAEIAAIAIAIWNMVTPRANTSCL